MDYEAFTSVAPFFIPKLLHIFRFYISFTSVSVSEFNAKKKKCFPYLMNVMALHWKGGRGELACPPGCHVFITTSHRRTKARCWWLFAGSFSDRDLRLFILWELMRSHVSCKSTWMSHETHWRVKGLVTPGSAAACFILEACWCNDYWPGKLMIYCSRRASQ